MAAHFQKGLTSVALLLILIVLLVLAFVYYLYNNTSLVNLSNPSYVSSSSVPLATVVPTMNPTASSSATLSFDNAATSQDVPLNGQYPAGVIDWGSNKWFVSAPRGAFTNKSLTYNGDSVSTASFNFLTPKNLDSIDVYNGDTKIATVTFSCPNQDDKQLVLQPNQIVTISLGWTAPCSNITVNSTSGWNVNFNNLVYH